MENLEVVVDHREMQGVLPELLYNKKMKIVLKQLDIGDFVISDRVVVERKNMNDFINSIIDGRVFSQAKNLAEYPIPIIAIVEDNEPPRFINKNAIFGAISSLIIDFGIRVVMLKNLSEFADFIYSLASQEQLENKREIRLLSKKKGDTLAQQQQLIVECLPMVGPKLAKNLLKKFKSVREVINADEKELCEVEGVGKKKARAIVDTASAEYRWQDDNDSGEIESD